MMGVTAFSVYLNTLTFNVKNHLVASLLRANSMEHRRMDNANLDTFSYLNCHVPHLHTNIKQTYHRLNDVTTCHTNKKSNLRNG